MATGAGREQGGETAPPEPAVASRELSRLVGGPGPVSSGAVAEPLWVQLRDGRASPADAVRAMSQTFGQSFSDVPLEEDAEAEARTQQAVAFTDGERIGFARGRLAPTTKRGAFTLAHELAHVVQLRAGADAEAGPAAVRDLEQEADRAATEVVAGRRPALPPTSGPDRPAAERPAPDRPAPGRTARSVLRQSVPDPAPPATATPTEEPVVAYGSTTDVVNILVGALSGRPDQLPEDGLALCFLVGRTIQVYRGRQLRVSVRLQASAAVVAPGIYRTEPGTNQVQRRYHVIDPEPGAVRDPWRRVTVEGSAEQTIDLVVAADVADYQAALRGSELRWWVRTGSRGGAGTGAGEEVGSDGSGAGGEGATTPTWATALHAGLSRRLRAEQLRLAELAQRTVGDTSPETLLRMYAMAGVPKRIGLGRSGHHPAEQVTIDQAQPPASGETREPLQLEEAHSSLRLIERDTIDQAWERVLTQGRMLYSRRTASGRSTDPAMGVPGDEPADPDEVAPNFEAYPSQLVNYGPSPGVTGVDQRFAMELDWSVEGRWAFAGPMALRGYRWEIFRIQDVAGAPVTGDPHRPGRGVGAGAVLREGFAGIAENIESSSVTELIAARNLVAIDAVLRGAGTLIRSYVSLVSQPSNEQSVVFDRPGLYVLRCTSAQVGVRRTERNPDPVVRAPSVALYPLRVDSARALAQATVAPSGLNAARTELQRITTLLERASEAERPQLQQQVAAQQGEVNRLLAADRANLPYHLSSSLADCNREIALLQTLQAQRATGRPPWEWADTAENNAARVRWVELQVSQVEPQVALDNAIAARNQLIVQQRAVGEVSDLKAETYRPRVAFVPVSSGSTLPVVMMLAEHSTSTDQRQRWVLVDVSVAGHRDRYEGTSSAGGTAGRAAAIRNALADFAGTIPYGRGEIAVRLPDTLTQTLGGEVMPDRLRANPDFNARFWQRLESLATAAAIAGLVVTGPVGAAIGAVGGVAGGAVAVHRMYRRHAGGYLESDMATVLDVLAIVGGAMGVAGVGAAQIPAGSRFVRTAGWVVQGVHVYGYLQLAQSVLVVPYQLFQQLEAIAANRNLSPGQAAALRAEAYLSVARSMLELAVTATQMIQHSGTRTQRRAAPPAEEAPPSGRQTVTPEATVPPAEGASPESTAPRRPVPVEEVPAPRATSDVDEGHVVRAGDIEHGMVIMAPDGQTMSRTEAVGIFDNTVTSTRSAEVALLRHSETGEYVVAIGDRNSVQLGEGNPSWREILPERGDRGGRWILEEHSHAIDPVTRVTPAEAHWPSGADGDFLVLAQEARLTGAVARGRIRIHARGGEMVSEYAYDPASPTPYSVDIALPGGGRYRRRYATIEDFHDDFVAHNGRPLTAAVPPAFPGARRIPAPERAPTPEPSRSVTPGGEVPPVARAPSTGEGPTRNLTQELEARQLEAQRAAESGDSARSGEATARLLEAGDQLLAGFEQTGLDPRQVARLLDAGVTPGQVSALHGWLGQATQARVAGARDPAQLTQLATVAERLAPLRGDPAVEAALTRMSEPNPVSGYPLLSPARIAERLIGVPPDQLPAFLRIVADPFFASPTSLTGAPLRLLQEPAIIRLIDRYGSALWAEFSSGAGDPRRRGVLRDLAERVAAFPEGANDLVRRVVEAGTTREQEIVLNLPAPPRAPSRPRPTPQFEAAPDHPQWPKHLERARSFAEGHADWLARGRQPQGGETVPRARAEVETMLATLYHVEWLARLGAYDGMSHGQKIALLDNFVTLTRRAGLQGSYQIVANRAAGAVSEALFLPEGATPHVRLVHPGGTNANPTVVDYELPAAGRIIPGRRNFVEQKSDLLSGSDAGISAADVATARAYVADAVLDRPGVDAPGVSGAHLIEFVRSPGNEVTRAAMLDVLLAEGSPFSAARFGGGEWVTKDAWHAMRGGSVPSP